MKHPINDLLQRLYHNSDDNLLQEFKTVEAELEAEGAHQLDPAGFERLWEKLKREHKTGGPQ